MNVTVHQDGTKSPPIAQIQWLSNVKNENVNQTYVQAIKNVSSPTLPQARVSF